MRTSLPLLLLLAACAGSTSPSAADLAETSASSGPSLPAPSAVCDGLRCQVTSCSGGGTTAIEGFVTDPAGKTKLYNAVAYVPNGELEPLPKGMTCDRCGTISGDPIATALSDEAGHFRLEGVPAGDDIPLVVQIGKWRRKIVVPRVEACQTTTLAEGAAHLPRNSVEGDLPRMAVVTGGFDELGCLLSRIGVDGAEYGTPGGTDKRIHIYRGVGGGDFVSGGAPKANKLWDDIQTLEQYDMVLLACEGWEYDEDDANTGNKTAAAKLAMREYAARGGRVFATHYHYTWFKRSPEPDFRDVAAWNEPSSAYGHKTLDVDTSFPKGAAFAKWLENVGASPTPGKLEVEHPGSNVASVNAKVAQRWLYSDAVAYMSFNTPVGVPEEQQCGRAVFSDIHVSGEVGGSPIPGSCGSIALTPQELALEFFLFDLAACVQPDSAIPAPPKPR